MTKLKSGCQVIIKVLVSITFLYLFIKNVDIKNSLEILKNCHILLASISIFILISTSLLLSLRLFVLLKSQSNLGKIKYLNIFKLTLVGIFFNNFLPTGAGGDIAKAYFLVKEEDRKLLIGSSVLIDRFIGALTIISMGAISSWLIPDIRVEYRVFLSILMLLLFFSIYFFTNKRVAHIFYSFFKKFLPERFKSQLKVLYSVFSSYFSMKKTIFLVLKISFFTQFLSIVANYMLSLALSNVKVLDIWHFFAYIPLIWTASLLPSLGGLGVREFTYLYFFSPHIGDKNSVALSVLILFSIIIQSVIGGIILIFLRPSVKQDKNFQSSCNS